MAATSWSEEDDRKLWARRAKPASQLASEFSRTSPAIRQRLKHLRDPTHKAYTRRVSHFSGSSSAASRSGSGLKQLVSAHRSKSRDISMSSCRSLGTSTFASSRAGAASSSAGAGRMSGQSKGSFIDLTAVTPRKQPAFGAPRAASLKAPSPSALVFPRKPPPKIDASSLNADQKAAADYVFAGGNAFLTGAAGVGKSYLLNHLIRGLRAKHEGGGGSSSQHHGGAAVVVAAATGIAATHIGGATIHSWAGVMLGQGGARVLVPRVLKNTAACHRWRKAKVLILDEVSMIDGMFFEALDAVGREVRKCSKPFGGIQLVLSGDFFQLPPVSLNGGGFAFECPAWTNAAVKMVELKTVVRQSGDRSFVNLLNQIRVGICPSNISDALEACHVSRKPVPSDGIVPTKLYCTNKNVDEENNRKLNQLGGAVRLFRADDTFKGHYDRRTQTSITKIMDKKIPAELRLKVGAQVMLTRNMPLNHLVNGSRGVVKSFQEEGKCEAKSSQGYGGPGQGYGGSSHGGAGASKQQYPVVHFANGVQLLVKDESVFQGGAAGAMTRSQLPLKLAWSITVHKSQGMTIERAELQLDDAFDYGQVYVALSRLTALAGLWVRGGRVTQSVVKAHPKVKAFYRLDDAAASVAAAAAAPTVTPFYQRSEAASPAAAAVAAAPDNDGPFEPEPGHGNVYDLFNC